MSPDRDALSSAPGSASRLRDLIAGLSIAGLLLPEAVAYSRIAALPPQAGIIGLFAGLLLYGLIGRSRFAIVSPTSSSAAVLAAATASLAPGDPALRAELAAGLTLVAGGLFVLAGIARLGHVTDFIAKPVLRGFTFGLALVIAQKQLGDVVGVHSAHADLPRALWDLLVAAPSWNRAGLATGLGSFAFLMLTRRLLWLPGGLIVIGAGILATRYFDLAAHGVALVGPITLSFAHPGVAALSRPEWLRLGELGAALVLILYSESYGSIRGFALKHGDAVTANRDLAALGAANLVSALFRGTPVGAGYSGTSANEAAGASSRLAGLAAAVVLALLVGALLPSIALTPVPVLAAIVVHAVGAALDPSSLRRYFQWRRDRLVASGAVLAVLALGVLDGLLVAIALSLAMMLRRLSQSEVAELGRLGEGHDFLNRRVHPEVRAVPGLLILRPEEPLFFANAERVFATLCERIQAAGADAAAVVLSLEETYDLDGSTLEALQTFIEATLRGGRVLALARLKHPVHQILDQVFPNASPDRIFLGLSVDDAVRAAQARLAERTRATTAVVGATR